MEDFSHDHLINMMEEPIPYSENAVYAINAVGMLEETIDVLNCLRSNYLNTKDKKYWWQMIQLLPSSYNQKRTVKLNYEVLANMYEFRKNHKLDEWRELMEFFKENCPYSEIFTVDSVKAKIDKAVNEALCNMKNDIYDMLLKFEDDDCEVSIKRCELEANLDNIVDRYLYGMEEKDA